MGDFRTEQMRRGDLMCWLSNLMSTSRNREFSEGISCLAIHNPNSMHISGISEVAKILGVPVLVKPCDEIAEYHYIIHNGFEFFELVEKR